MEAEGISLEQNSQQPPKTIGGQPPEIITGVECQPRISFLGVETTGKGTRAQCGTW